MSVEHSPAAIKSAIEVWHILAVGGSVFVTGLIAGLIASLCRIHADAEETLEKILRLKV